MATTSKRRSNCLCKTIATYPLQYERRARWLFCPNDVQDTCQPHRRHFQFRYADASRLNVRKGPSKKAKTVWTLKRDQRVLVTEKEGVWAKVKGNRYEGWVRSGFLTPNKAKPNTTVASRSPPAKPKARKLTNAAIIKVLIKRSYAYYSGNCPCPYSRTARGHRCGRRSAYSRPGGASPLYYRRDISSAMIKEYRERQ